uniref:Uncharacterized protein n=1 Tax=viral metagenome TaxID=1070528 RepID=A0A6M3K6Q7_9ZZZZ
MYRLAYCEGKVHSVIREDGSCIPLVEGNTDFQDFLKWNSEQEVPLDLNSTIKVVPPEPKTTETFTLPVVAPDFIVSSPKPKIDHLEAHAEAIAESLKANKSIALIVLDLVVYINELEIRLKKKGI